MKNLIIISVFCIVYSTLTSCEKMYGDFLEKAPGVDVTIDTVFSSVSQMEKFLAECYQQGVYDGYPEKLYRIGTKTYGATGGFSNAFNWSNSCDESRRPYVGWHVCSIINTTGLTVVNAGDADPVWDVRYNLFRMAYTMMDRIDKVPGIDPSYATIIKGEMKFLIAHNYFEMFKRYGGVPIVTKVFGLSENIKIPRSSVDSLVQFMITNCEEAAAVLPDAWPSNFNGRITKGAALAQKARILLWAASPMFNTATPYMSMDNPANNRFLCYGDYDINRWKAAADAAKAVLDWAPAGSIQLVTNQGVDKNYKYVWEVPDNSEIILGCKALNNVAKDAKWWQFVVPLWNGGFGGVNPTQNFVEKFYDNRYTGKPIVWYATGNDLNQKYDSMDYRFKQTVGYNGSRWNNTVPFLQTFSAPTSGLHYEYRITGYWMKKFIPDAQTNAGPALNTPVNWPVFRLAEFYLTYAEALNEFNSSPPAEAYTAVNTIRNRSGMPNLPAGLTQAQFRDRVRKEWGIEYAFEDRRFWDIKRWLIGENQGVMVGSFYKLNIAKIPPITTDIALQKFSYERAVIEIRVYPRSNNLFPFTTTEVNKGYLVQNPGY